MQTSRKNPTTAVRGSGKPTVAAKAREIVARLRRSRNPARARGVQQYFKHEIVALGIDTPTLRRFATDQSRPLVGNWSLAEAARLCDRLLHEPELEVRSMGILILSAFKRQCSLAITKEARRWLETRLDNWALVDMFCGSVLSPLLEKHPEMLETLRQWSRADSLWVRRAALVTLVPFARRGSLLDTTYAMAREHFPDTEDLMHKAVGWLLREAGKTDMDRLRQFLLRHGPAIPRTTLRYAIERFPLADRRELLVATRGPLTPVNEDAATGAR